MFEITTTANDSQRYIHDVVYYPDLTAMDTCAVCCLQGLQSDSEIPGRAWRKLPLHTASKCSGPKYLIEYRLIYIALLMTFMGSKVA